MSTNEHDDVIAQLRARGVDAELSPELETRLRDLYAGVPDESAPVHRRPSRWTAAIGIAAAVVTVAIVSTAVIRSDRDNVSSPPITAPSTSSATPSVTYSGEPSGPYQGYQRSETVVDRVTHYNSLGEMGKDADLIVVGQIESRASVEGKADEGTDSTTWNFSVQQIWKTPGSRPAAIQVVQQGAINEAAKTISEVADDPLFQTAAEMVLFLKANTTGTYRVSAGPQGRFVLNDGLVSSFAGFRGVTKNTPLADFRAQVQTAINTPLFDAKYYCGRPWTVPAGTTRMRFWVNWISRMYNNQAVRPTVVVGNDTKSVISDVRGVWVVLQKPNGVVAATLPVTDLLARRGQTYELRGLVSKRITIPAATSCDPSAAPLPAGSYTATMVITLPKGDVVASGSTDIAVSSR
ncbi:hypothetical protein ABLG96_00405 [Nakamurella sp. A5-74]|uniref:Uncharacterized protein n=1 Tax=Nakamurella sp. A5-74 TaxID=3158264 RepID=A0AAU8DNY4_9ACTN